MQSSVEAPGEELEHLLSLRFLLSGRLNPQALEQGDEVGVRGPGLVAADLERELVEVGAAVRAAPLLNAELVRKRVEARQIPLVRLDRAEHREVRKRDALCEQGEEPLLLVREQRFDRPAVPDVVDLVLLRLAVELR